MLANLVVMNPPVVAELITIGIIVLALARAFLIVLHHPPVVVWIIIGIRIIARANRTEV